MAAGELHALATRLGSSLASSEPAAWGDSGATVRITLADGRVMAARRSAGPNALATADRLATTMRGIAAAGLPVPSPDIFTTAHAVWLVSSWVEGETGAEWLDVPARARILAGQMGALARQLRGLDVGAVGLGDGSPTADGGAARMTADLASVAGSISAAAHASVGAAIERVGADASTMPVFVHGDLVPVNVVLGPDGAIRALLDLEHSGLGSPLADTAWWGWVVRHHHPAAWTAAWPTFCAAAGVDPDGQHDRMEGLVRCQLLGRAAAADGPDNRQRWLRRLEDAAG
jgi:aminoglycoside phosphotransferase (APT) family kinase protein